jgi:hypothetical protein
MVLDIDPLPGKIVLLCREATENHRRLPAENRSFPHIPALLWQLGNNSVS